MPRFHVGVSQDRYQEFWVEADNIETARKEAEELADALDSSEWEVTDTHIDVADERRIKRSPDPKDVIWRGGPEGNWEVVGDGKSVQQVLADDQVGQADQGGGAGDESGSDDPGDLGSTDGDG